MAEHSKKLLLQLDIKQYREEKGLLGLGAVEVGLSDRNRNLKPRTQLLLARIECIYTLTYLFFHPLIFLHEPNPARNRKKVRVTLFVVIFSIRKHRANKGVE